MPTIPGIVVAFLAVKPAISPTIHQVRQTCDTIVAQVVNPILGKLYFKVIISSAIDPKLKRPLLRLTKEASDV